MDAREAIEEAFYRLSPSSVDGFVAIGDVAHEAAILMGGQSGARQYKRHLIAILHVFEHAMDSREASLPFHFSTHLARDPSVYRCGRRRWPSRHVLMADGVTIGGRNYKLIRKLRS